MPIISWSEQYSVHVREFDLEHQHLIELINQLHDAMKQGKGRETVGNVLRSLVSYTQEHFAHEERLMTAHGYPGLPEHQREHQGLTRKVLDYQQRFESSALTLSIEVMEFLKDWLIHHIQQTDAKYSAFFNARSIQ